MPHHRQVVIIRVRLDPMHFLDGKSDVGNAAQVLRLAPDVEFADFCHHRRVGGQIMLDADHHIAAGSEYVRQERIFGELDCIAVVEDRQRQDDHAGIRLHFPVPPDGNVNFDWTIASAGVVERERLVTNRPLAHGEVPDRRQHEK